MYIKVPYKGSKLPLPSSVPSDPSLKFGLDYHYHTDVDGTIYKAEVIGSDPYSDIAVLLVKGVPENKLKPVEFINNSSNVLVGEQAATIGTSGDIKWVIV